MIRRQMFQLHSLNDFDQNENEKRFELRSMMILQINCTKKDKTLFDSGSFQFTHTLTVVLAAGYYLCGDFSDNNSYDCVVFFYF